MTVDLGTALIITGMTTPIWIILLQKLSLSNWFKKQTFREQMKIARKENTLKFKKLEKDMGLKESKTTGVDNKTLLDIASKYLGNSSEEDEEEGILGSVGKGILDYVKENPEVVEKVLGKKDDNENTGF